MCVWVELNWLREEEKVKKNDEENIYIEKQSFIDFEIKYSELFEAIYYIYV